VASLGYRRVSSHPAGARLAKTLRSSRLATSGKEGAVAGQGHVERGSLAVCLDEPQVSLPIAMARQPTEGHLPPFARNGSQRPPTCSTVPYYKTVLYWKWNYQVQSFVSSELNIIRRFAVHRGQQVFSGRQKPKVRAEAVRLVLIRTSSIPLVYQTLPSSSGAL